MLPILAGVLAFASITLFVIALGGMRAAPNQEFVDRLSRLRRQADLAERARAAEIEQARAEGLSPLARLFSAFGRIFDKSSWAKRFEAELERADWPLRGGEFVGLLLLSAAGGAFIGLILVGGRGILLAPLGAAAPYMALKLKQRNRKKQLDAQIGDMLSLVSSSLKAGYSFLQALETVSRESPPPMSTEIMRTLRTMNLGKPTEEALLDLGERTQSADMDLVVTAVMIQRQVGGNLAEVLDKIAFTIRERVRIRGEIKALTAQGRMSGIIIGALPLALGVFIGMMNPSYIGLLFSTGIGRAMIGAAIVSELIGIVFIRKIIDVEV